MTHNAASPSPTKIESALVVDDHPLFCDALAMTLQAVTGTATIRATANLEAALTEIRQNGSPDIVVLDLNLPDVKGFDGLIRLKTVTQVPIIVVSSMSDNRVITSAIKSGAAGFVPKHSQRDVFAAAFDAIRRGEVFIPDGYDLINDASDLDSNDAVARLATLTNQQARILQLICEGKLNKQIAFDLSIAETTVKAHVTAIMRKLGVQSRTQAVLIANETSFGTILQDSR
ncbi:Protease production enhancer protein [Thalassovita gelatinovora]|uniref:Protease production enhancer protein n=1 Tax=Thalassovita gelatinovora TaxID=53501 RepID=A0A0P1FF85_THAGE|nr:response regulator transcription factor [Thalassovita gelatinovora]QIZ79735.1 response regulator transcription factor [Thalassovita gelatinovora]CUH66733.1 Protease production enhancer protein [Thalassovita gelatinovora]SEQ41824.1 two component transcriptional regulator, LuxR family [Thalassovita gelatinovora]